MKGLAKALVVIAICGVLALAGGGLMAISFLASAPSESTDPVVFEVRPGESFKSVAHRLETEGLLTSAWKFELFARMSRTGVKMGIGRTIGQNAHPLSFLVGRLGVG